MEQNALGVSYLCNLYLLNLPNLNKLMYLSIYQSQASYYFISFRSVQLFIYSSTITSTQQIIYHHQFYPSTHPSIHPFTTHLTPSLAPPLTTISISPSLLPSP